MYSTFCTNAGNGIERNYNSHGSYINLQTLLSMKN